MSIGATVASGNDHIGGLFESFLTVFVFRLRCLSPQNDESLQKKTGVYFNLISVVLATVPIGKISITQTALLAGIWGHGDIAKKRSPFGK